MKKIGLVTSIVVTISALIGSAIWVSYYLNSQNQIDPEASEASSAYAGLSRFATGHTAEMFAGSGDLIDDYAFGWYHNWSDNPNLFTDAQRPNRLPSQVEFLALFGGYNPEPIDCTDTVKSRIRALKDRSYVVIGNEIGFDDKADPTSYAIKYHSWYECIKSVNSSIKVAVGANAFLPDKFVYWADKVKEWKVDNDPKGRWNTTTPISYMNYLKYVRDDYKALYGVDLKQDYYMIHLYPNHDYHDVAAIQNSIREFRKYMKGLGHQKLDLFVKEMGILDNAQKDVAKNADTLKKILELLNNPQAGATDPQLGNPNDNNRLVQRWAWFVGVTRFKNDALADWYYHEATAFYMCSKGVGNLDTNCATAQSYETELGKKYRQYIQTVKTSYDILPPSKPKIEITKVGSAIRVTLTASDNKGISNYSYAIGSTQGKFDFLNWQDIGKQNVIEFSQSYTGKYITVQARDDGFNSSEYSTQLIAIAPSPTPVASLSVSVSPTSTPAVSPTISPSISVSPTASASPAASVTPDTKVQEAITKADLDINGKVGVEDFVLFLEYYKAGNVKIDYNADGKVVRDINDFVYFIDYYKTYNDYY